MMFLQVSGVSAISNLQTIKVVVENQYNYSGFAKKILSENKTSSFVLQKVPILHRKTAAFAVQNRLFYNAKQYLL